MKNNDTLPTATEILRRNLLYRMMGRVTGDDMDEIVDAAKAKAKAGDAKFTKIIFDMVKAESPAPATTFNNSAVYIEGQRVDAIVELRKLIVALMSFVGPQTTEEIASRFHIPGENALQAIQCDLFTRQGQKWILTAKAREGIIDMPARVLSAQPE